MAPPSLVLHVCCAPCATEALQSLQERYRLTLFFSNSNIDPPEEYARRLEAARILARQWSLPLIEDSYDHEAWRRYVRGLEDEPERGIRCAVCFEFNLMRTACYQATHGLDGFTTTLCASPHKNASLIAMIGRRLGPFVAVDFKKQREEGFQRRGDRSRRYGLYRQTYCGCEFSLTSRRRTNLRDEGLTSAQA